MRVRLKERRKYLRLNVYHLARYKIIFNGLEKTDLFTLAYVRNISANGLCLLTEKFLPLGSIIEINICFPHLNTPVTAIAKVVFLRQVSKTGRYEFGVQFIEMNENLREFIDEQINFVYKIIFMRGGERMKRLSKIFVVLAGICIFLAMLIKLTTLGTIFPAAIPVNWIKLADTALLFAIALALIGKS